MDEPLDRIKLRDLPGKDALEMIQLWTGRYILRPQNLPQVQLNFDSFSVLTKREALMAVESLLTMNGIAMTKIDNLFWKAVPALGVNAQVPIWLDGSSTNLAPSQRIYIKMFHLLYAPAVEVRDQLNAFATPNVSSLLVFEKANSILITDSLLNLQRIEKLLETIDRPISKEDLGTEFFVWETQHAGARELETKLKAMIEGSLKPFLGGTTQVDSDDRTGKLLVVTRTQNLETIQFLLDTLDSPIKTKTSSDHYKLQHAEAKDVKAILDEVIKNQLAIKQKMQNKKSSAIRPPTSPKPPTPGNPSKASSVSTTGEGEHHQFSDFITISADERSNAILVYGMKEDIEEIRRILISLDQPLPLVRIDTIFVMVDLSQDHQRGIDALFKDLEFNKDIEKRVLVDDAGPDRTPGTVDDFQKWEIQRSLGTGDEFVGKLMVPGLAGSVPFQMHNWKLTGIQWSQIFAQSEKRNDVRIFSTPSLMVSHNSDSVHILIEDERTLILPRYGGYGYNSGYRSPSTTNNGGTSEPGSERDILSAKTMLEIKKPKIGLPLYDENGSLISRGSVFMEVELKAEKFDETDVYVYEGQRIPSKKNREAKTFVTVKDREIMVIGGLQEVQLDTTESRYNLLSDIPYFGKKFFQPKTSKYTPTELLIFLRPTIIDTRVDELKRGEKDIFESIEDYKNEIKDDSLSVSAKSAVNREKIDARMSPHYVPRYKSPSGEIMSSSFDENYRDRHLEHSEKDSPSSPPLLINIQK